VKVEGQALRKKRELRVVGKTLHRKVNMRV
jgi:hypothetical protein